MISSILMAPTKPNVIQTSIHSHRIVRPAGFLLFDDYHCGFQDSRQHTRRAFDFSMSCFVSEYEIFDRNSQVLPSTRQYAPLSIRRHIRKIELP